MVILNTSPATTAPEQLFPENGHFFEGAEKRLVVYYAPTNTNIAHTIASSVPPDLRTVSQSEWEEVLEKVNCKIIHSMSNSEMTAYLLSESSMFITRNCVLIKTCGTTTLLLALPKLLQLAPKLGLQVVDVYYSHKNLLIPQAQSVPHLSFDQECDFLNSRLPSAGLKTAFSAGNMNLDRFFLYAYNSATIERSRGSKNEHLKFEMIMENLNEAVMEQFIFTGKPRVTAKDVTINSGISRLIPQMQIDDYIFDGCGYSMNGFSGANYLTIHITPEKGFSFVSLETNVPMEDYGAFVRKVLKCFKPGKLLINLMIAESEKFNKSKSIFELFSRVKLSGFNRLELTMTPVKTLNVIYARYSSTK